MKARAHLFNVILTALFAALTTVMTAYFVHIPTGIGYLHFGDAMIFLAACFLPRPYAMAAGALGGGLADLLTYPAWALPTTIIKALIALPFSSKGDRLLTGRNAVALLPSGIISTLGYAVAGYFMANGNLGAAIAELPSSLIQAVGSAVIFVLLAVAMDKFHLKRTIGRLQNE